MTNETLNKNYESYKEGDIYSNGKTRIKIVKVDGCYLHYYHRHEKDNIHMTPMALMTIHLINGNFHYVGNKNN